MNIAKFKNIPIGYFFLLPFVLAFLVFGLYPVYNTVAMSFTDATVLTMSSSNFIGLDNFVRLFADKTFINAMGNTWLIWALNFLPQIGAALFLAVVFTNIRLKIRGVGVWRTLYFLPNLIMPAVVAALFAQLFGFPSGPMNQILVQGGFMPDAIRFLEDVGVARGLVVFINWWTWFGQTTIILMAGMTSIPVQLYEAAMVDGASAWQLFTRITLPLVKPILIYIFVTSLVGGMQMLDIPFLLTNGRGAPENSIQTSVILMYMRFSSNKGYIGSASAVGVVIFLVTTVCALGIFYFMREKDDSQTTKKSVSKKNVERA